MSHCPLQRPCRFAAVALVAAGLAILTTVAGAAQTSPVAHTAGIANPTHDIAMTQLLYSTGPCAPVLQTSSSGTVPVVPSSYTETGCKSPCYPTVQVRDDRVILALADTPACTALALESINVAQATEGVHALVLPTNYYKLSVDEQLFVLTNLERVTRGIPPLVGLVPYLDHFAALGASDDMDPELPFTYDASLGAWRSGPIVLADGSTSILAVGDSSPAAAMFDWMYDDGWGGSRASTSNGDCTSPRASGCWGHRDNILGGQLGTGCRNCLAGAGFVNSSRASDYNTSYAMVFVAAENTVPVSFSWDTDVLPYLTAGYERVRAP